MGLMQHHAVIATTFSDERAQKVHEWILALPEDARGLFLLGKGVINSEYTIVLIPDGSKEGWEESDWGDRLRADFTARLREDDYDDGSSPWMWVEVAYGELGSDIVSTNRPSEDAEPLPSMPPDLQ